MMTLIDNLRASGSRSEVQLHEDREEAADTLERLFAALKDSNAALVSFVNTAALTREPYETPLSAYDRGCAVIESLEK